MHWNCHILYTWLYITDSNSFNFIFNVVTSNNNIILIKFLETLDCTDKFQKDETCLQFHYMRARKIPHRHRYLCTKHVYNLRWRSNISELEKSLINIWEISVYETGLHSSIVRLRPYIKEGRRYIVTLWQ